MAVNIPGMLVVIVFYMAVMSVGVWSGRKVHNWRESGRRVSHTSIYRHSRAETSEDRNVYLLKLFVANRDMPVLVGIASLTATWVGAGYLLGSAAAAFSYGILYVQAPIGYAISLLCGGLFFAQKMRNTKSLTMIDPLQQHYGRWIGLLLSLTAAVADIFWTAATFTTLGQMANVILGVDGTMFIVATAMCTFTYTGLGGLYSVAYTDILQLAITIVGMWICVVFCATSKVAGMLGPPDNQWQGPSRGTGFLQMMDSFIMAVCGGIPWQVYFQRVLASRTVFDAKMVSYMTALGCLAVSVPAVVIGGIAKNANFTAAGYKGPYNLRESEHTQVLALSMHWLCPGMVSVFGLNALLAAIMSSVDSSMLSAATVITRNIYQYVVRPSATDTEMAVVLRAMICLLGALSALLALSVTSVIDLWMAASDVVFVLLFPQLVSLFYLNKWTNSYGAFLGFVVGAVLRGLCGERSLGIPVVLQLPMYDAVGAEQRFPFRTFCMLTSLSAMMVGSHMARMCFEGGWLPKTFDVCGCFEDTRRRRRTSSFYGDKEFSKSALTSPGGPSSNDAEPPSHAETGTVLSSPEDGGEHPPHPHAEVQDHRSDMAEAPDNRTNVVEAQEHRTIMAEAQDHRTNTAEDHDHRHRTNTAEAHDHRANAAESKERPRRKSSVSAKKKRRASKHAVTSPTKRGEDDPGAEAAGKTSP